MPRDAVTREIYLGSRENKMHTRNSNHIVAYQRPKPKYSSLSPHLSPPNQPTSTVLVAKEQDTGDEKETEWGGGG
jgi:hypothetical protein